MQNVATPITSACLSTSEPSGTGGTIADGTYVLSSQTQYRKGECATATYRSTMTIDGPRWARVDESNAEASDSSGVLTSNENLIGRISACGPTFPPATYTATPTVLTIFNEGGAVTVWMKQ